MASTAPNVQSPGAPLEARPLQAGTGVGTFVTGSQLAYPTKPVCQVAPNSGALPLSDAAGALAENCVLYFDLQVGWNVSGVDLNTLSFDIARGGSSTNRGYGVYLTTPVAADVRVWPSTYVLAQRYTWQSQSVNLSNVPGVQGLLPGDVVRVKIAFWTGDTSQTLEIDNLKLQATVHEGGMDTGVVPLRITDLARQAEALQASWTSSTSRIYAVEFSEDLVHWAEFPTNFPAGPANQTTAKLDLTYANAGTNAMLLQYRMGQLTPHFQDSLASLAGGPLTPGTGLNDFQPTFYGYASSPALLANFLTAGTTLTEAIAKDNVFRFSVTVSTNVGEVDLTRLTFNVARGGTSTPRGYGVMVHTPTTTNQQVRGATLVNTVRYEWDPHSVDLSGVASLQNLKPGQTVTFAIPMFTPGAVNSLEFDDLTVRGTVTPRLLAGDLAGDRMFLRIRERPGEPILVEAATRPDAAFTAYATRTLDQLPSFLGLTNDGPLSLYGGTLRFRTNATGYFYPLKVKNRWWLVDPEGYLFLHQGVAAVATINSPGANAALLTNFGNANNWALAATSLLRQSRFSGAGAWSDINRLKNAPAPLIRTRIANFLSTYSATNTSPGYPQVFDASFAPFCFSFAQQFTSTRTETTLLGYFSDNELSFPSTLLSDWLALPSGNASYDEAWRWLRARYGAGATTNQVTSQDRLDFLGNVWGRYYSVVNQAIKSADPNHLYLGSRLFSSDKDRPEIFRAIGPHVDVISVNHYSQWTPNIDRIRMWEQEAGKPVIITEFYVKGEDSGMTNSTGAGWVVHTQKDRGAFYQNFVLTLLESRVCVGWHWFKYTDNDPDSNPDPSNIDSNKGVVSNRYVPYDDLLEAMRRLNERTYRLTSYFDGEPVP
jgi:hypothetical protein